MMLARRVDVLDSILAGRPVLVRHLDRAVLGRGLRGSKVPDPGSWFRVRAGHLDAIAEAGPEGRQAVTRDGLTEDELARARATMKAKWPREAVRELRRLPRHEMLCVAACAALLDAAPLPAPCPTCALCGRDEFRLRREGSGFVCAFTAACSYRVRVAYGMPRWRALKLLEAEKAAA